MTAPARTSVGLRIKEARERLGYTQAELAELVGLNDESISRIELGRFEPSLGTIVALADVFGTSIDALMGRAPDARVGSELPPLAIRVARRVAQLSPEAQKAVLTVTEAFHLDAGKQGAPLGKLRKSDDATPPTQEKPKKAPARRPGGRRE